MKKQIISFIILTATFFLFSEDFWMRLTTAKTNRVFYTCQDELYINTDSAIFVSNDNGISWVTIPTPQANQYTRLQYIDKTGNILFCDAMSNIYTTHKDTMNWELLYGEGAVMDIHVHNDCLFLIDWGGVTKSNKEWTIWKKVLDHSTNAQFNAFVVDSTGTVFTGSSNRMPSEEGGIYRSFDDGDTWEWYPKIFSIYDMAVDSEGRIFAADFEKILKSTDNGDSWQNILDLGTWPYCMLINSADEIYIGFSADGGFKGVIFSEDHGLTWEVINEGLDSSAGYIRDMSISSDGYIYLATDGGVYKSMNSTTGIEDSDELFVMSYELEQNYPNPFNNQTNIGYILQNISEVQINVFNSRGELVHELLNKRQGKGTHSVIFNADNRNSGIYYYQLKIDGIVKETKKMLYLR